jgi:periplasmic protein TonB
MVNPSGAWIVATEAHLEKFKRFMFWHGEVVLEITVDRRGRVLSKRILESSGIQTLDDEAFAIITRAVPLPPPPPEVGGNSIPLTAHIQF